MPLTGVEKRSWHYLPAGIRLSILETLLQDGCSVGSCAAVSREWQKIIEPHNFGRIKLTSSRLADFGSMIDRNRALVRYIWLCLELEEYDCTRCAPRDRDIVGMGDVNNALIATVFMDLFSALSAWEPNGNLLLDISIHSPSDSKHYFKYLTFKPDIPANECDRALRAEALMLAKIDDRQHGWMNGLQYPPPPRDAIEKVFDQIMDEGPFDDDEQENQWWQHLPLVPAVTGVLLRQQTRRRWKPAALTHMLGRLPRLQEVHYEPWREWSRCFQRWTDKGFQLLVESLASNQLQRLVLFENFNEQYPLLFMRSVDDCDRFRIPSFAINQAVAKASLELEGLSTSFIVDARDFFDSREPSWKWRRLTSLALTSQQLTPHESPIAIDNMLRAAAAAAMEMPNLETMEIWNGQGGFAMLFRYQITGKGGPAVITCRGTWELGLHAPVVQAWEAVALKHRGCGLDTVNELLDARVVVRSHAAAIHHLKLVNEVIRPVSLRQIRMEHRIRERTHPC